MRKLCEVIKKMLHLDKTTKTSCIFDKSEEVNGLVLNRTFHAVGQGAFYSEVFVDSNNVVQFVVVYDCGTETGTEVLDKDLDSQIDEFKNKWSFEQIDMLFISHFHLDHVSGLEKLLKTFKIKKTVIPMLSDKVLLLTRIKNLLDYGKDALTVDGIMKALYEPDEIQEFFGEVYVVKPSVFVMDESFNWKGNGKAVNNGEVLQGVDVLWEYVPFNSIPITDASATTLKAELRRIGAIDAKGELIVKQVIHGCKTSIRQCYKKAINGGDDNLYTMTLESRPAKEARGIAVH